MKYHVIVTGSRPDKDSNNRFLPVPQENIDFIHDVLSKVDALDVVNIYHGAAPGVDTIADYFAYNNNIMVKQFPAYWQRWSDSENKYIQHKGAGPERNRVMVNAAKDAAYNKTDEMVLILSFTNKPLELSLGTKHCTDYAKTKGIAHYHYDLPVKSKDYTANKATPFD